MRLWQGAAIVMVALVMTGCGHGGGPQSSGGTTSSADLSPDAAAATIDRELAIAAPPMVSIRLGDCYDSKPELVAFERLGWVRVEHFAPPHMPEHVALTATGLRAKGANHWPALSPTLGEIYLAPYGTFKFLGVTGFKSLPPGPEGQASIYADFNFRLVPNELGRSLIATHVRSVGFDAKVAESPMHGRQMFVLEGSGWVPSGKPELHESEANARV